MSERPQRPWWRSSCVGELDDDVPVTVTVAAAASHGSRTSPKRTTARATKMKTRAWRETFVSEQQEEEQRSAGLVAPSRVAVPRSCLLGTNASASELAPCCSLLVLATRRARRSRCGHGDHGRVARSAVSCPSPPRASVYFSQQKKQKRRQSTHALRRRRRRRRQSEHVDGGDGDAVRRRGASRLLEPRQLRA